MITSYYTVSFSRGAKDTIYFNYPDLATAYDQVGTLSGQIEDGDKVTLSHGSNIIDVAQLVPLF